MSTKNAPCYLLIAALGACAPAQDDIACRGDCRLEILLPEDPAQPPRVPDVSHVAGGQSLNLVVSGRRPAQAHTVISFEQAAFEDEDGHALHTLELITGYNHYRLRSHEAGVCRPPRGCRYVVVNAGFAPRPPRNGDPRLVIAPDEDE